MATTLERESNRDLIDRLDRIWVEVDDAQERVMNRLGEARKISAELARRHQEMWNGLKGA